MPGVEHPFEADVTGLEIEPPVEPVRLRPAPVRRQLDPETTGLLGQVDGRLDQAFTYPVGPEVRVNVQGLDLGAKTPLALEMTEDDHLTHPDDLPVQLGDQEMISGCRLDVDQGRPIGVLIGGVLFPLDQGPASQQFDHPGHVGQLGRSDRHSIHARQYRSPLGRPEWE